MSWSSAIFVAVGGGGLFGVATAGAWVYASASAPPAAGDLEASCSCAHPSCSCSARVATFDALSGEYDREVGTDETVMGLPLLRWWLLRHASGAVLEIAAGTGSNFNKYPAAATSITATDASRAMLDVAAAKVDDRITLRHCRVEDVTGAFDTVVDTFGLCSFDDPQAALLAMQRATKRGGTLLFLEHGRSHYDWLNTLLDRYAAKHLERWGCSWNRDYTKLIKDAGLQVVTMRRFHFGTTYFVIAKPDPALAANPNPEAANP